MLRFKRWRAERSKRKLDLPIEHYGLDELDYFNIGAEIRKILYNTPTSISRLLGTDEDNLFHQLFYKPIDRDQYLKQLTAAAENLAKKSFNDNDPNEVSLLRSHISTIFTVAGENKIQIQIATLKLEAEIVEAHFHYHRGNPKSATIDGKLNNYLLCQDFTKRLSVIHTSIAAELAKIGSSNSEAKKTKQAETKKLGQIRTAVSKLFLSNAKQINDEFEQHLLKQIQELKRKESIQDSFEKLIILNRSLAGKYQQLSDYYYQKFVSITQPKISKAEKEKENYLSKSSDAQQNAATFFDRMNSFKEIIDSKAQSANEYIRKDFVLLKSELLVYANLIESDKFPAGLANLQSKTYQFFDKYNMDIEYIQDVFSQYCKEMNDVELDALKHALCDKHILDLTNAGKVIATLEGTAQVGEKRSQLANERPNYATNIITNAYNTSANLFQYLHMVVESEIVSRVSDKKENHPTLMSLDRYPTFEPLEMQDDQANSIDLNPYLNQYRTHVGLLEPYAREIADDIYQKGEIKKAKEEENRSRHVPVLKP